MVFAITNYTNAGAFLLARLLLLDILLDMLPCQVPLLVRRRIAELGCESTWSVAGKSSIEATQSKR